MASEMTVKINHAVYDTYSHQNGANLTVDPGQLQVLLSQGDAALDRGSGMFFETIGDRFIVVFSGNRTEGTKARMRYFDVFTSPVESISVENIDYFITQIKECRVPQYGVEPAPTRTVTLPQQPASDGSHFDDNPTTGGQSQLTGNEPFIAEMWEQIRRSTFQCQATLEEVAMFFSSVDGALQQTSYVSRCSDNVDYFDISGEEQLAMETNPEAITTRIAKLAANGRVTYDALPTYREELEQKRKRERKAVKNDDQISDTTSEVINAFYADVHNRFEEYPELAAKLMQEIENESLLDDEEKSGGLTSRFSELITRGDERYPTDLVEPTDYPHIDDEVIATVDAELAEEQEQIKQDIKNRLVPDMRNELLHKFDRHAERLADDAMSAIEDTRTSTFQERAKDPDKEY